MSLEAPSLLTLPPELLVEIFLLVLSGWRQDFWDIQMAESHIRESFILAVDLSRVCKHFRTVALAAPMLWNNVDMCSDVPSWIVRIMLERSGQTSLQIEVDSATDSRVFKPELHRIVALVYYRRDNLERFDVHAMPMLQELYIDCENRFHNDGHIPFISALSPLLHLRRLSVLGVSLRIARRYLRPTLTHIRFWLNYDNTPPLADFLIALGNMPLLEKIILSFSTVVVAQWPMEGVPEVTLPRLRRLQVIQGNLACAVLLQCLRFPVSTFLSKGFTYYDDDVYGGPELASAILSKLSGLGLLGSISNVDELIITACSTNLRSKVAIRALKNDAYVYDSRGRVAGLSLTANQALECLCSFPPPQFLRKIRYLTIQTPDNSIIGIPELPSTRLMARLCNLRYLHLKNAPTLWYGLVRLHYRPAADPIPHTTTMPFPKLRSLNISNAPFRSHPPRIGAVDLGDEEFIFQLRDMLKIRRDAGVQLCSLYIWDPIDFNGEEDAELLRAYVMEDVVFENTSPESSVCEDSDPDPVWEPTDWI
ncbi:hypothetical protein EIP91_009987 [Steccherinum ochraceum]|uniref:Uncharacterized protein n=1 Tax=Steccherinum ochraceum TaxID=92696 RepID=A0A4R0RNN8_9APHY|nr:hypothetical protein EIP91_009987 [Steccherinum ochraceum]